MAEFRKNGKALEYASEELRSDKDVVLAAVGQNGAALRLASFLLRGDKEVVLKAVFQNSGALEYASEKLKNDKDVLEKYNEIKEMERIAQEAAQRRCKTSGLEDVFINLSEW